MELDRKNPEIQRQLRQDQNKTLGKGIVNEVVKPFCYGYAIGDLICNAFAKKKRYGVITKAVGIHAGLGVLKKLLRTEKQNRKIY